MRKKNDSGAKFSTAMHGRSMVEALAVLCIAGVLLSLGLPMLAGFQGSADLSAATTTMLSHINLAKSEAVKRGARVALCKSSDGASCTSSGGWEQGWIVFLDLDASGSREASEQILRQAHGAPQGLKIVGNAAVSRYVGFRESGETRMVSGGFQAGTITICRMSNVRSDARQIVISIVGRARVVKTSVETCA